MALTLLSACPVAYKILNGSAGRYSIEVNDEGTDESLMLDIAWEDVDAFLAFAKGRTTGGYPSATRYAPLSSPFRSGIFARRIRGDGVGAGPKVSPTRPWPRVHFTIDFGPLKYDPGGSGPFQSIRYRALTSVATVPGATLHFASGEAIDHDYGILLGQFAIEITQYQIADPTALITTLLPKAGRVNSDAVTLDGFIYAAGSLLFPTFDAQKTVSVTGGLQSEATVNLIYRAIPWNSDVRSDGVVDEVLPHPYQTTTLSELFT